MSVEMEAAIALMTAEVSETKDAVAVVLAKVADLNTQVADLIAQLAVAAGIPAEVTRLAGELNTLQEQIAAVVAPPVVDPAPEPAAV